MTKIRQNNYDFEKWKIFIFDQRSIKLRIMTNKDSVDLAIHEINFTANGIRRDPPPAWELSICTNAFFYCKSEMNLSSGDKSKCSNARNFDEKNFVFGGWGHLLGLRNIAQRKSYLNKGCLIWTF